jgi:hypothetical protein
VFGIGEDIHNTAFGHALTQQLIDQRQGVRLRLALKPAQHGFAVGHRQSRVGRKGRSCRANGFGELSLEFLDKLRGVRRNADSLTIGLDLLGILFPTDQLVAIVIEVLAAGHAEISGVELHHRAGEHAEFQVSPIDGHDRYITPMSTCDDFPPTRRNPREVQRTLAIVASPNDEQPSHPRIAMAQHKGDRLLQGCIRAGRLRLEKRQDIQAELTMRAEEWGQEGQVAAATCR